MSLQHSREKAAGLAETPVVLAGAICVARKFRCGTDATRSCARCANTVLTIRCEYSECPTLSVGLWAGVRVQASDRLM